MKGHASTRASSNSLRQVEGPMLLMPISAWHMHPTTLLIGQCLCHLLNSCIPGYRSISFPEDR